MAQARGGGGGEGAEMKESLPEPRAGSWEAGSYLPFKPQSS